MSFDPELNEVLGDPELIRIARLMSTSTTPEPPLDDAFKTGLRRQLMAEAWERAEGGNAWWRVSFRPQIMAWAGAAAVVVIAASVVFYTASQPPSGTATIVVGSPQDGGSVPVHEAILVSFNQPMDHASTENAVQVTPATTVAFRWSGDTQLYVQPTSGDLAPNTQYLVTIGPGATTQAGTKLDTPKTVTFVTQPVPTPAAPPSPSPRNNSLLTNQAQLTTAYPPTGTTYPPVWSADSKTVYFVGGGGALEAIPAGGGQAKTLVPDGVSLPAMAPAGDRLAYVRAGKIEVLTLASGATSEIAPDPAPTTLRWVKDQLEWGSSDGVFTVGDGGPVRIAAGPDRSGTAVSIAPDGTHALFQSGDGLLIVDVASGRASSLCGGGCATTFEGWSADGTRVVYGGVIASLTGRTITSVPGSSMSWSANNEILLGSDTGLYEMRPDGLGGITHLADGTYNLPVWAPDSATFVFVRSGLWVATAPPASAPPPTADAALTVVNAFMNARLHNNPDQAQQYLDDAAKAVYNSGTPPLIPTGTPAFKRFYVLMSEVDPSSANTVRVVVRLVFGGPKIEMGTVEETLTLKREQATDPFLIDAVTASAPRVLGRGPEVVAVKITSTEIDVTFDSDLVPTTIAGVTLQDANGMTVSVTPAYSDRVMTLTGAQLTPGAHYRLVVLPTVLDVGGRHTTSEYDLDLIGPAPGATTGSATPGQPAGSLPSSGSSPTPGNS